MLKMLVILGSIREGRNGQKVADWLMGEVKDKFPEIEFEFIDVKELNFPLFDEPVGPSQANKQYNKEEIKKWSAQIDGADAFIIITPEYNHGYSSALKNAIDYLYPEWHNKPVAFVGYGGAVGGARAVEQLRQVAVELQMAPIREAIYIPTVWSAFEEDGKPKEGTVVGSSVEKVINQLKWWAEALKVAREKN
jgi:NAD(P)H-dependent FMN reductase